MSWNNNLWDVTDELVKYLNESSFDLEMAVYFFKEKAKIDSHYSKSIQRLIKEVQKNTKQFELSDFNQKFTFMHCFRTLFSEHLIIANQAENLSELSTRTSTSLKNVLADYNMENRKLCGDLEKITNKKNNLIKNYHDHKKLTEVRKEEARLAEKALDAENAQNSVKAVSAKLKSSCQEKKEAYEKSEATLAELSEGCREMLRRFYFADLPENLSSLEENNIKKISSTRAALLEYVEEYNLKILHITKESLDSLTTACQDMNYELEHSYVGSCLYTGYLPPNHPDDVSKKINDSKFIDSLKTLKKKTISRRPHSIVQEYDDFSKIAPAKRFQAILNHIEYLVNSSKNLQKEILASKKLLLTVPKYGGKIQNIQSHYTSLEEKLETFTKELRFYHKLYLKLGGDSADLDIITKVKPRETMNVESSSEVDKQDDSSKKDLSLDGNAIDHKGSIKSKSMSSIPTSHVSRTSSVSDFTILNITVDYSGSDNFKLEVGELVCLIEEDPSSNMILVKSIKDPNVSGWIPSDIVVHHQ